MSGSRRKAKAILSPPFGVGELPTDGNFFYFFAPSDFTPGELLDAEGQVDGGATPEQAISNVLEARAALGD